MFSPTANFKHGHPLMVDHTPAADVKAGDVVVTNDTPRVAHLPIASGVKGALAARGGVYDMPKSTAGGSAIADDKKVYWDATNKVVTLTASTNKGFGVTVGATADGDAIQRVIHAPF